MCRSQSILSQQHSPLTGGAPFCDAILAIKPAEIRRHAAASRTQEANGMKGEMGKENGA